MTSKDISHSPKIRLGEAGWPIPLTVAVVVGAFCLALRRYGVELADEGVLLAQIDRVTRGQVPYRDFHTGYGPALFALNAALGVALGMSSATVRLGLAVVHAVRAGLVAALGGWAGGRGWSVTLGVVLVAFFMPVAPGVCTPVNIPYPSWYADGLGLTALALLVHGRSRRSILNVGLLWGVVFTLKQNSGLLGLGGAAATLILLAPGEAAEDGGSRGPGCLAGAGVLASALVLLRDHLDPMLLVAFVVPLVPVAVGLGRSRVTRKTLADLGELVVGFLVVAGPVVALMVVRAGARAVWTDFLQIGTDTARVFYVAYPTPGGVGGDVAAVGGIRGARIAADAVWFGILPLLHLVGTVFVATGRVRSRVGIAVTTAAAIGYLQLYPRMDFWHLLPVAGTSLAALAVVMSIAGSVASRVVMVGLCLASGTRFAPTIPVLAALASPSPPTNGSARLDIRWDLARDERLRRIPDVVAAVKSHARIAGFPALGIVNFGAGVVSPWRHDYFFPGRPGPAEERELAEAVERDPPDAVVVLDATSWPFAEAFAAHPEIVRVLRDRFVEERRIGPYRILVPRPES